ncbi:hypothetical protein Ct61P_09229 [Colletotrichum tofieldiae]|nr:hypothetical protein Ct61P_09229 [Colletotrichum tofieldiae]
MVFNENNMCHLLPLMDHELDKGLWSIFSETYIWECKEIMNNDELGLRQVPIIAYIKQERRKSEAGFGHGHRDDKG